MNVNYMRRFIVIPALILLSLVFPSSGSAFQNEPDGFRGIKWGELFVDRKDMDPVRMPPYDDDEVEMHIKLTPEPPLGDVDLFSVRYEFWRGRFIGGIAGIRSESDFRKVKSICEGRFGPVHRETIYPEEYIWKGDKATIRLRLAETRAVGVLAISSSRLREEQYKIRRERDKAAVEKGF